MNLDNINPSSETSVRLADLDDIRTVLLTTHTFFSAKDISDSAANGVETRFRPLTREVDRILKRVEGLIAACVQQALFSEDDEPEPDLEEGEDPTDPEEEEIDDELPPNPLGSRTITPRQQPFFEEDINNDQD